MDVVDGSTRPWWLLAACYGSAVDFFPVDKAGADQAKAICATCPVDEFCLEEGMSEPWGIWGGYTPSGRQKLRKAQRVRSRPGG